MKAGVVIVGIGIVMWMLLFNTIGGDSSADDAEATPTPGVPTATPTPEPTGEDEEPTDEPNGDATPEPTPVPGNGSVHTVVAGDTMQRIANQYDVSLQALIQANPQIENPEAIAIGDQINIPN